MIFLVQVLDWCSPEIPKVHWLYIFQKVKHHPQWMSLDWSTLYRTCEVNELLISGCCHICKSCCEVVWPYNRRFSCLSLEVSHFVTIVLFISLPQECILSGLMSQSGKKVLHIDRNSYYGGESASMSTLEQVCSYRQHINRLSQARVLYFMKLALIQSSLLLLHVQLYRRFKVPRPAEPLGRGKEWNIDLIPKFFLASGKNVVLVIWFFIIISINLLNYCPAHALRWAGENFGAHWGDSICGF